MGIPAHYTSNDNFVFLLGAGASAGYDCPVMNGFMERARHNYFTRAYKHPADELVLCYRSLLDCQGDCLRSSWVFKRNWENIEEIYTQADLFRLANRENGAEMCKQIAWSIWDVYRNADVKKENRNFYKISSHLVTHGLKPIFITTNYDTAIEKQLGEDATSYHYPGFSYTRRHDMFSQADEEPERPNESIPIVKLHGSVNWFQMPETNNAWLGVPYNSKHVSFMDPPRLDELRGALGGLYAPTSTGDVKDITPAIIPPMLGKESLSVVIARQWEIAIQALSLARQVWIVGYSFPKTDTFMLRLLDAGLGGNRHLQKVVICDKQIRPDWEERLIDMFAPVFLQHRVEYCPVDAQEMFTMLAHDTGKSSPNTWPKQIRSGLSRTLIDTIRNEKDVMM